MKGSRPSLGHTESIPLKLHPDLKAHLEARAAENYCTIPEYLRRLVIADMHAANDRDEKV